MRRRIPYLTIAMVVAAFVLGMVVSSRMPFPGVAAQSSTAAGLAPELGLPDTQGQPRSLSEWRGQVVVVNFWATWCPPCLHEIPMFIELQESEGPRGVQFLGVAIDELASVREFAEAQGLNYPTTHGQQDAIELMRAYGNATGALPYTVLVGADGRIVERKTGAVTREEMHALLDAALAAQ